MSTQPTQPIYYASTGKRLTLVDVQPIVRYCVRWPGGTDVWMTQEEFDTKVTNERPRYSFAIEPVPRLIIEGSERSVRFKISRNHIAPAQDVSIDHVRFIVEHLTRWLNDREVSSTPSYPGQAPIGSQGFGDAGCERDPRA